MPKPDASRKRVGEILVDKGFIRTEQLEKALAVQRESSGLRLGQTLIHLGLITEDQLAECLAQQLAIPYISIRSHQVGEAALVLVPKDVAKRYGVLPLDKIGNILTIAMYDDLSHEDIAELEKSTGCRLKFFFVTFSDFKAAYAMYYPGETYVG